MSNKTKGLLLVVGAALIAGAVSSVTKIGLREIQPFSFTFLRFLIGGFVVLPWIIKERAKWNKDLIKLLLVSLLPVLNIAFFVVGVKTTTASISQMLYAGTPMLAGIFSYLIFKENVSLKKWLYIFLGLFGVFVVILLPILEKGQLYAGDLRGNILVLIGVVFWSLYIVLSKPFHKKYSPQFITAVFIVLAAIVFGILQIFDFNSGSYWWNNLSQTSIISVVYVSLLATVVAYTMMQYAVKLGGPVLASLTLYLQPVFAYISAANLLGEQLTQGLVIGTILIFISIALTSYSK